METSRMTDGVWIARRSLRMSLVRSHIMSDGLATECCLHAVLIDLCLDNSRNLDVLHCNYMC